MINLLNERMYLEFGKPGLSFLYLFLAKGHIDRVVVFISSPDKVYPVPLKLREVLLCLLRGGSAQASKVLDLPSVPIVVLLLPHLEVSHRLERKGFVLSRGLNVPTKCMY